MKKLNSWLVAPQPRLGVIGLLVILAFFKYNGAFAAEGGWQAVAMPLGISFYSFAAISYLIDAARGDCEVETNFIDCVLYLNFFATITQGPICRAGDLLPQLKQEHRFDAARTVRGLRLLALVPTLIFAVVSLLTPYFQYAVMIYALYYILIGFSLDRFICASYTNGVFDKLINVKIDGAQVGRGLYVEEDDDEDKENAEGTEAADEPAALPDENNAPSEKE
mgnify:CR=1 FL=1